MEEAEEAAEDAERAPSPSAEVTPEHPLVVARLTSEEMKNSKLKDIIGSAEECHQHSSAAGRGAASAGGTLHASVRILVPAERRVRRVP
jgi:hypothetical protein